MFKRYKLQPKKHKPLTLRSRKIGVSKRISDEVVKILAMLKHSSSTVRMRGAREAEKLENISEDMIKELMKMSQSDKKEVRSTFYTVSEKLLSKALPSEKKTWEELLLLYMDTMKTCTIIDVRKDSLSMLDLLIKHFPTTTHVYREDLIKWLENDLHIISLESKFEKWKKNIEKKIPILQSLKKADHVKADFSDRIHLLHTHISVNQVVRKHFLL